MPMHGLLFARRLRVPSSSNTERPNKENTKVESKSNPINVSSTQTTTPHEAERLKRGLQVSSTCSHGSVAASVFSVKKHNSMSLLRVRNVLLSLLLLVHVPQATPSYVDVNLDTTSGRCIDYGHCTISVQSECDQAAAYLGYSVTTSSTKDKTDQVSGCFVSRTGVCRCLHDCVIFPSLAYSPIVIDLY